MTIQFEESRLKVYGRRDDLKLVVEVVDAKNRYVYTVRLADLYSSETELNGGRFKQFSQDRQRNRIRLRRNHMSAGEIEYWYSSILNWIADHCDGTWSATVAMHDMNTATFEFSFLNDTASVAFALIFS